LPNHERSRRPDHQTVVACIALALTLITGSAYAAATIDSGDVANNSLKSVDLKNGAGVKGADVRRDSLRAADFGRGARASIRGSDVAQNALGGSSVDEDSLAVSAYSTTLGGPQNSPVSNAPAPISIANGSYTQAAGEANSFFGRVRVGFAASCIQPRGATIFLLIDGTTPSPETTLSAVQLSDSGVGAGTAERHFVAVSGSNNGMAQARVASATPHVLSLFAVGGCSSGSGITIDSVDVDVVRHR